MKENKRYSKVLKREVMTNMPTLEFNRLERIIEDICESTEEQPNISMYDMVLENDFPIGLEKDKYYVAYL